jgi:alpha-amylase
LGKNAATYVILAEGIPFMYQGFETLQNGAYPDFNRNPLWPAGWQATEMSNYLATLNKFRNGVINKDGDAFLKGGMKFIYIAGNALVFQRGSMIVVLSNAGSDAANLQIVTENTEMSQGTVLTELLSGGNVTVGNDGVVSATITKGMPMVFYPAAEFTSVVPTTMVNAYTATTPTASSVPSSSSNNGTTKKSLASGRVGSETTLWGVLISMGFAFAAGLIML